MSDSLLRTRRGRSTCPAGSDSSSWAQEEENIGESVGPSPTAKSGDRSSYGVLKLTLLQDGYDWAFIPVEGATFQDSGTGKCH